MAFGLMLWLYKTIPTIGAGKRLTVNARIVGYKQFPSDKTLTDDNIYRGPNFRWLRVVAFRNPQTSETLEMYSNPGIANPEPIGTNITVNFNPSKTDPIKDYVWVQNGMRSIGKIARVSFATGFVTFIILQFIPESSPLQFLLLIPAFTVVFVTSYIYVWKQPNQ